MEVVARGRHLRFSPRKARLVVDQIRGRSVDGSLAVLRYSPKRVAQAIEKVVRSAVANAEENHGVTDVDELFVVEACVDPGPIWRRFRPRSMGMASRIRRRTCHITIVLSNGVEDEAEED
jgi:large subunit ribosomal protein L22